MLDTGFRTDAPKPSGHTTSPAGRRRIGTRAAPPCTQATTARYPSRFHDRPRPIATGLRPEAPIG